MVYILYVIVYMFNTTFFVKHTFLNYTNIYNIVFVELTFLKDQLKPIFLVSIYFDNDIHKTYRLAQKL